MTHDTRILLAMRRGDEAAARRVWTEHSPAMLAHAGAVAGRSASEDVVQSVFLSILRLPRRAVARVRDPAAWLARLTRHAALNHLRASRREASRRQPPPGPSAYVAHDEALSRALAMLDRRERELIVLKHVAGLTFEQIAEALGKNRNTIVSRHRAALARLREMLTPREMEVADAR
ncbi:MAG: sigma-70 family RNA polymerase sigma factor [Phycisphaerales bacterium]|nr:sigma-70 family RNA polymerase sigma factor [Phycisphaerales bacterium]